MQILNEEPKNVVGIWSEHTRQGPSLRSTLLVYAGGFLFGVPISLCINMIECICCRILAN